MKRAVGPLVALAVVARSRCADRSEEEIEVDDSERVGHPVLARQLGIVYRFHLADEALLHPEYGVVLQVGAARDEQVRNHGVETRCTADEVDVRRPVGVTIGRTEQLTDGAVLGYRVEL